MNWTFYLLSFPRTNTHRSPFLSYFFNREQLSDLKKCSQAVVDFYKAGITDQLLKVSFGDVMGSIESMAMFEHGTAFQLLLKPPPGISAGLIQVTNTKPPNFT
jgi:hypothetical protein